MLEQVYLVMSKFLISCLQAASIALVDLPIYFVRLQHKTKRFVILRRDRQDAARRSSLTVIF